jgi:simple sugar transport system ATP-binding protein
MERDTAGPPDGSEETGAAGGSPASGASAAPATTPSTAATGEPPRVEIRNVTKRYGSLHALRGVDLSLRTGEIVGLVGDNGAGKSTLVNIISGALQPTSGEILIDGKPVTLKSPIDARRAGIETVYQDLALAPDLSIWQNMFLGREETVAGPLGKLGWLDRGKMSRKSAEDLKQTKIRIPSAASRVGRLSGGQRQAVAVGRAVAWGSRVVLMDEPTAALGVEQQEKVGELIGTVAESGTPVLLISHNLPQVYAICTRVVVLFHGQIVADLKPAEVEIDEIVGWITGSSLIAKGMAK